MGLFYSTPAKSDFHDSQSEFLGSHNLKMSKMNYGYHPDKHDHRDYQKVFKVHESIVRETVKHVDLRDKCPTVFDQGKLGSCTANAICACYSFIFMRENGLTPDKEELFSRLFLYWNERSLEGTVDKDSGASLRDGIKSIHKNGIPQEKYWPYVVDQYNIRPSDEAYIMATNHVAVQYHRLQDHLHQLKQCLMEGHPFVFGFTVYESFESKEVAKTGMMPMPKDGEQLLGGHAVMAVGFDDNRKCFIIRNSWGSDWGDGGYFYMPYDFIFGRPTNQDLPKYVSDLWVVEKTKDTPEIK
jgi:C1A family cysteine protease